MVIFNSKLINFLLIKKIVGDPTLGRIGNQVINENQELLYDDLIPVIEKQFAEVFQDVANQIIGDATFDELFPDN